MCGVPRSAKIGAAKEPDSFGVGRRLGQPKSQILITQAKEPNCPPNVIGQFMSRTLGAP